MMHRITTPHGITVSYDAYGSGPPLVLVHGGFSDHLTNWQEARDLLAERFSVFAIARRGRGETTATEGHSVMDEAADVAAMLRSIGEPVALLGHSYGAACALEAAVLAPALTGKLVLYERPRAGLMKQVQVAALEQLGRQGDWDGMVQAFMRDVLLIPPREIEEIQVTPFWDVWVADAPQTLQDLRALVAHPFDPGGYRTLAMPVQLVIGSESPRELYATDALAAVLPDVRIHALQGQAHEGMTTDPRQFVEAISQFLLADRGVKASERAPSDS